MLLLDIPSVEYFDDDTQQFVKIAGQTLRLEHSLVSLSKWEAKHHKAYIGKSQITYEESVDYVKCMTLTQNVDPLVYLNLNENHWAQINAYIENPMTATTIADISTNKGRSLNGEQITSELIYYWMFTLGIPMECQKWHLNRLIMLIRVFNAKNQPEKKIPKGEIMRRNKALNEARRKKFNTKG